MVANARRILLEEQRLGLIIPFLDLVNAVNKYGLGYYVNHAYSEIMPYPRTPWDKIIKTPKGNVFDFYHIQEITGIYKDSLEKGCKGIDKALVRLINYEKDDRAPTGWGERTCLGLEVYRFNTKREKYGKC